MEIPFERLPPDILRRIIEEFVLREGTDYGAHEFSLDEKVAMVQQQLQRGKIVVMFDEGDESCTIVPR